MARESFHAFITATKWADREEELFLLFDQRLDVISTMKGHVDIYNELVQYMLQHIQPYAYTLDDSSRRWVPIDFLIFMYNDDTNFKKRLQRFVEQLTEEHYQTVQEDLLISKGIPNVGLQFMSWEMTCIFFIQQTDEDPRAESSCQPGEIIHERIEAVGEHEEDVDFVAEKALALTMVIPEEPTAEEEDKIVDLEDIKEHMPHDLVECLFPVVVNNREYLFLSDIQEALGFREDEALSALSVWEKSLHVDYTQDDSKDIMVITDAELAVAKMLQDMKNSEPTITEEQRISFLNENLKEEHKVVIDRVGFQETPEASTSTYEGRGCDITRQDIRSKDDDTSVAFEVDKFAGRKGGHRETMGREASLAEYIGTFQKDSLVIFHNKYSPHGREEVMKCKALSKSLCQKSIDRTADKVILVLRELVLAAFGLNYSGQVIATAALGATAGVEDEKVLLKDWGTKKVLGKRRKSHVVSRLEKLPKK